MKPKIKFTLAKKHKDILQGIKNRDAILFNQYREIARYEKNKMRIYAALGQAVGLSLTKIRMIITKAARLEDDDFKAICSHCYNQADLLIALPNGKKKHICPHCNTHVFGYKTVKNEDI